MAKWRRGGGRKRWEWKIEALPRGENGQWSTVNGQLSTEEKRVDPFEHDDPYDIRNALAAMENETAQESGDPAPCDLASPGLATPCPSAPDLA